MPKSLSRRDFLKVSAVGLAMAGLYTACKPVTSQTTAGGTAAAGKTLKILQTKHFVPAFDEWFDKEFTQQWGQANGVTVTVDHVGFANIPPKAAIEATSRQGHDLVAFPNSPAAYENEVVDLADVVQELEAKAGPMSAIAKRGTYNPKTQRTYGVSDYWVPFPIHWRTDLWEEAEPGAAPDSWDDLLRVGSKLKTRGKPVGIGLSAELDSNMALHAALFSHGASIQDEGSNVVINSPQTVEAVKMMAALYQEAMPAEVLAWSSSSNNQFLLAGAGSLILNAISALRTAEKQDPNLAKVLALRAVPQGPVRRLGPGNLLNVYTIWKFSPNIELAKKFLLDLINSSPLAFQKSESYNMPSFPGAVPGLKDAFAKDPVADPPDKYALLANALDWSTNPGYPGSDNAATNEVIDSFIIPKMFAMAARRQLTPTEAAQWAEKQIAPIFAKWKTRGLV